MTAEGRRLLYADKAAWSKKTKNYTSNMDALNVMFEVNLPEIIILSRGCRRVSDLAVSL